MLSTISSTPAFSLGMRVPPPPSKVPGVGAYSPQYSRVLNKPQHFAGPKEERFRWLGVSDKVLEFRKQQVMQRAEWTKEVPCWII